MATAAEDLVDEAIILSTLAMIAWSKADFGDAKRLAEESLLMYRRNGEEWAAIGSLCVLGMTLCSLGEPLDGGLHLRKALTLARAQGDPVMLGYALEGLGWADCLAGRLDDSQAHFTDSLDLRCDLNGHDVIAESLDGLAMLCARRAQPAKALRLAGAAETTRQRNGQQLVPVRRQMRDGWMAAVRDKLGQELSERAFVAGMKMTLDDALALAHGRDEPTGTSTPVAARTPPLHVNPRGFGSGTPAAPLTPRQLQVAVLVAQGLTNRQIAERLVFTERASVAHIERIMDKLGVNSRTQIGVWVSERGLLTPRSD